MQPQTTSELIALPLLPRELREVTGTQTRYKTLYRLVTDGAVPAVQVGARWFVEAGKLSEIAAVARAAELALSARRRAPSAALAA
ncbi:MAG: hypothetical protein RQ966_12900 [Acetobacteraceae bacterium]|nr:hypothetical protein [Acetobacteraceae bacterium]